MEILKLNSSAPLDKYLGDITTKLVLIEGDYICKLVYQFFGLGFVCYWVCQFLGWWLCLLLGLSVSWGLCLVLGLSVSWAYCWVLGLSVCGFVSM